MSDDQVKFTVEWKPGLTLAGLHETTKALVGVCKAYGIKPKDVIVELGSEGPDAEQEANDA
jgi:hypothetical protein